MKKILIIAILTCISSYSFSQSFSDKKIEIQNEVLKTKISDYIKYVKSWAIPKKDIKEYLITLDQQTLGENTIFTLHVILLPGMINHFSPSAYTLIDETPVLLHSGIESFVVKNQDFFSFLKTTYWKDVPDAENKANIEKQMKEFEEAKKNMPDSVVLHDENGTHKVPTSGMKMSIESNLSLPKPKSWILYFKGQYLKRETEDRFELRSQ
ncbi:MAG: hypothetical protein ABIN91_23240 [Mucilaginibacter sp.]|uniref:hypothetical protein n=1 Tax=Mucilaginibacter sp. TaxID=1882438 RepID=UPI0032635955